MVVHMLTWVFISVAPFPGPSARMKYTAALLLCLGLFFTGKTFAQLVTDADEDDLDLDLNGPLEILVDSDALMNTDVEDLYDDSEEDDDDEDEKNYFVVDDDSEEEDEKDNFVDDALNTGMIVDLDELADLIP